MPIYISYVPVWICLGNTLTNEGDVVKVFMPCNPTVYLLVIQGSEGKHILCLISHLLSGWIHSFSKMPYGDTRGMCARVCVCVYSSVFIGGTCGWQIKWKTKINCFSKVLGQCVSPEQLQCTLTLILQVSEILLEGWKTLLPNYRPTFSVLMRSGD